MRTVIIAEIGVNHNGDIAMAKKLIAEAAACGADVAKFQTFNSEDNISFYAPKAEYQITTTGPTESQLEMVRRLELRDEDHDILKEECDRNNIIFLSTAFDLRSIELIEKYNFSSIKIPSGEITNLPLLRRYAKTGKDIILSTGMATLGEVERAIEVFLEAGISRSQITVLHCTTEYPAPMHEVNLRAMVSMAAAFNVRVGYSDHTEGFEVALAAVALGATMIEKHFTLDRSLPGPDHAASLEPSEMRAMVKAIRNIEAAMGDGIKRPSSSEMRNRPIARKSLVARCPIAAGELLTEKNITAKRPGSGISPMYIDSVIGTVAKRAFTPDELIEL